MSMSKKAFNLALSINGYMFNEEAEVDGEMLVFFDDDDDDDDDINLNFGGDSDMDGNGKILCNDDPPEDFFGLFEDWFAWEEADDDEDEEDDEEGMFNEESADDEDDDDDNEDT
jgi:hypothetical protein